MIVFYETYKNSVLRLLQAIRSIARHSTLLAIKTWRRQSRIQIAWDSCRARDAHWHL